MKRTTLAVIVGIFIILAGTFVAILFARGYNFDISKKELSSTGILVATSDPDGAEVLIDGKLKTATNNTINLVPGIYKVAIQKDGYTAWEKIVDIKKEEVVKTNVFLFPSLSDLRPLTFTGAKNPQVSTDNTKIVYGVASASAQITLNPNGVWIIDMGRLFVPTPVFSSADFRQIYRNPPTGGLPLSDAKFSWSPDNKQILAYYGTLEKPTAAYLLDTDRTNDNPVEMSIQVPTLLEEWNKTLELKLNAQTNRLPLPIKSALATSAASLAFSPDETKVLYTATASATLPIAINAYLPGKNPTPETRSLKPNAVYGYDIKEDRNYLILDNKDKKTVPGNKLFWFPSSRHLVSITDSQISIMEFDGTNRSVVYNGQFDKNSVFAWPNWSKLVILTTLGSTTGWENLYTINFR